MSSLERRLHEALTAEAGHVHAAPDLAQRVRASVAADREARRRRRLRAVLLGLLAALTTAGVVRGVTDPDLQDAVDGGGTAMTWWMLELATNAVLVALALWLGPFIKRFGRAYAADVFHDNPLTGKSYIVLTDIVYYLIFTAYILFTATLERRVEWVTSGVVDGGQLGFELRRIAGILLIIGILHGANIVVMPILGRLFSLNRRLTAPTTTAPSQREVIDRQGD